MSEEGPDPNDLRRHMRKMLTEAEYRRTYRRIDFYQPNSKQLEFHNRKTRETLLRAGNQIGKTQCVGAQMTFDALSFYPEWYEGRKFITRPPIERAMDWLGWAACTSSHKTRDGAQVKLLGDIRSPSGMGQGLIPLDNIVGKPSMNRGIPDFVDSVNIRRETGGSAVIRFKTYEQGREGFQSEAVDCVWLDEDLGLQSGRQDIYGECLARLTTTRGRIYVSMSPLPGKSPMARRFIDGTDGTSEVLMTIWDAAKSKGGHIPDNEIEVIIASYPEHERATRAFGAYMQGEGAVFIKPVADIKHSRDPASVPEYWPWLWAFDFSHSGMSSQSHPFAAVLGCWDRDNDTIYIMHALRMRAALPVNHVAALMHHPRWGAPVAWPHDGGRQAGLGAQETIAGMYRRLGANMRGSCATFPDGGFDFEAGITEMATRFASGRLLVAQHLSEWFDEYINYHRVNGLVERIDDDLMSATRQLVMDIRYAKTSDGWRTTNRTFQRSSPEHQVAANVDFDLF